ncbi:MAG: rRNA maturation RNase YbeY [Gammaproteobacteria bacterium]|nr:MAG: rRNA maturation RNase YbeY [Gammaproteobacteria bacterium]
MPMRLVIERACEDSNIPSDRLFRRWAHAVLDTRKPDAEVYLRIVSRDEMRSLNHEYRGKDKPTNVLSFPAGLPAGIPLPLLGDIAICASVVSEEAVAQGKPVRAHWAHMLVHGLLHLLGHDHQADKEAAAMEAEEIAILRSLDIASPYE